MGNSSANTKVLVLDDEALIAFDIADIVTDLGAKVIGPATSLDEGFALAKEDRPDVALLDIDVAGRPVWPLAGHLKDSGCRIVFVSANTNHSEIDEDFPEAGVVDKPASPSDIEQALGAVV